MTFHTMNRLAGGILLIFLAVSMFPLLLFGFQKEIVAFALCGGLVAVFITALVTRMIVRPLRNLTKGVNDLGNGNLDHRLPVAGSDEIARLASAFNSMADSLRTRNKELTRKELSIEKMLDPLWFLDAENRVVDINPAFTKLFGHERRDVIGRYAGDFFDEANRHVFEQQMTGKRARGLADVYEVSVLCNQVKNIPVLISGSPIMENDQVVGAIDVFKDISARKELEDYILKKNRELLALNTIAAITSQSMDLDEILRNTIKEVTAITGMDAGGIYWVDEQKREITCAGHIGVPDHLAHQMEKFKFGEDIPGFVAITGDTVAISNASKDPRTLMNTIKQMGMQGYLCLPLKSKDKVQGILCMLSHKEHAFTSDELEFLRSVGHIVGVAIENIKLYNRERSRLSGLVSLEKNRAEAVLSSIGEGVYTTDRDFHITYWNKAAETITGFKAVDIVGKTCVEVLGHVDEHGELLCGSRCGMRKYPDGQTETQAAFCSTARGRKLPTALTSAPIKNETGEEIGRVTVFRDITLEIEADRMKTDFVRTVSHEIRTPLSTIVGMARMLMDGKREDDRAARQYLATIHSEGQRLASMVEELLDIARIESGMQEIRKTEVSLRPVIESCIEVLSEQAAAKGVRIRWDGPKSLPSLHADEDKLRRAVFNLLNNAISYCDRGAVVTINAETKNGYLSLSLEDTGWGISEQDLPYIFKKFYRSKTHAHRVKGTGLGLPLVLEIIKAHDGTIDVESQPGKGSRFTVRMPIAM